MKRSILLCLMATAIVGCHKRESMPLKPKQSLTIAFNEDPRSFDPLVGIDVPSSQVLDMIGEGLFRIGPEGKVCPGVATDYTVSPDGKTYTFYLREAVWSNGDPLTAHDFEASWKRAAKPENALGAYYLHCIENVQEAMNGAASADSIGVKAVDDHKLVVRLKHPLPSFPEMSAMTIYYPVHTSIREGSATDRPITNGPFTVATSEPHNRIIVKKNHRYWDREAVGLEQIQVVIVPDQNTQSSQFERGEIDWFGAPFGYIPNHMIPTLDEKFGIHQSPTSEVAWIFVNTDAAPFDHPKMRKAFAYAANRSAISSTILNKLANASQSPLPDSMALSASSYFEDGNTALAKQLFQEALDEMGLTASQLPPITLYSRNCDLKYQISQALQAQWQAAFNIPVEIRKEEWGVFYDRVSKGNYQLGSMGWVSYVDDPIWFLQVFDHTDSGINRTRWENAPYSELLANSQIVVEASERKALMQQAEQILMEEMPVIPLFSIRDAHLEKEGLKGVVLTHLGQIDFKWAHWEE